MPIFKLNNLHECHFPSYWTDLEEFFVLHTSLLEKMVECLIFVSKHMPSKVLKKLYEQMPIKNQKSLPNMFSMLGSDSAM
jgi:hypothetical protein